MFIQIINETLLNLMPRYAVESDYNNTVLRVVDRVYNRDASHAVLLMVVQVIAMTMRTMIKNRTSVPLITTVVGFGRLVISTGNVHVHVKDMMPRTLRDRKLRQLLDHDDGADSSNTFTLPRAIVDLVVEFCAGDIYLTMSE